MYNFENLNYIDFEVNASQQGISCHRRIRCNWILFLLHNRESKASHNWIWPEVDWIISDNPPYQEQLAVVCQTGSFAILAMFPQVYWALEQVEAFTDQVNFTEEEQQQVKFYKKSNKRLISKV